MENIEVHHNARSTQELNWTDGRNILHGLGFGYTRLAGAKEIKTARAQLTRKKPGAV